MTFHAIRLGDGALGMLELSDAWPRRAHLCAVCGTHEEPLRRVGRGAAEDVEVRLCPSCDDASGSN
ncbi:hypothetical protein [Georgenia thermotolerans]|uniref:Uncharacterized protein n=1 Tax=Georgenia thermotolerans TaxID=527326 RepID=A0A7J5US93_9MICO|nr:hypothetical protein [Georgenia thermotolerans]KAE8765157.1 hypothetical protein GB883_05535 [Georgenia thermotolerans]